MAALRSPVVGFALAIGACSGAQPSETQPESPRREATTEPAPLERWDLWSEQRSWEPLHPERFVSRGHANGRFSVEVVASPRARDAYTTLVPGTELPVASVIAKRHFRSDGSTGPVYAMRKSTKREWEFLVLRPDGLIERRGSLPLCRRCHSEAVADSLFGLPRDSRGDAGAGGE